MRMMGEILIKVSRLSAGVVNRLEVGQITCHIG